MYKFIELARVGQLEDAVRYARAELARYFEISPLQGLLEDSIALLAYEEPLKSSVGYLLGMPQRESVADAVNAMVLSTNPDLKESQSCLHSCLENLLRQLTACCLERRALNGDQGEAFNLHRVLHSGKRGKRYRSAVAATFEKYKARLAAEWVECFISCRCIEINKGENADLYQTTILESSNSIVGSVALKWFILIIHAGKLLS
ncbi:hypothetical protein ACLOJK_016807 [Asimina triloba]